MESQMNKLSREEILEAAYQLGFEYEHGASYCAQAAVAALQDVFHLKNDEVFKASCGLSGGVGGSGVCTCGALSGSVMMLSALFGRNRTVFDFGRVDSRIEDLATLLVQRFEKEFDGLVCRDVQKKMFGRSFNFKDDADREVFIASGGHTDKCPSVVGTAARLAAEIILDEFDKLDLP